MATGRIGVTPTLGVRWSKAPAGGTTSLSGLDDNSVSLVYSVGYEQVYRNGVLLSRTNDYTATNGTTITLVDATIAGDIIEVFANELVPLTDAISKGQFNAKGALLSATAASTPGVLAVGSNDQVLTADSTTSTGLKWAAVAAGAGNMAQIATGTLSGASVVISSLSTYTDILIFINAATNNTAAGTAYLRLNATSTNHNTFGHRSTGGSALSKFSALSDSDFYLSSEAYIRTDTENLFAIKLTNCKNAGFTDVDIKSTYLANASGSQAWYNAKGIYTNSEAVSSITLRNSGGTWSGGTYTVWGA